MLAIREEGCARMQEESAGNQIEANKLIARRYLERISAGDAVGVANLFTEDGVIVFKASTPFPPVIHGREAIRALMEGLPKAFPRTGLKIFVEEVTAEADRVSITSRTDAVHANGKRYLNRYHFLLFMEGGKIRRSHEYLDSLHIHQVLSGDPEVSLEI